jgi:peptidoglycan/xylan/chitin deacetylase (PgdA/CDA1 family)
LTYQQIYEEMTLLDIELLNIIGKRPVYMRLPYGNSNALVLASMKAWGYIPVVWNADTLDWSYTSDYEEQTQATFDASINGFIPKTNSIISLQHEFVSNTVYTWTQTVITEMKAAGYTFVTTGECLGNPDPNSWYRN